MSTVIAAGYRCRLGRLEGALAALHTHSLDAATRNVKCRALGVRYNHRSWNGVPPWARKSVRDKTRFVTTLIALEASRFASERSERYPGVDIDTSANVWLSGGWAYIIGYGELWDHAEVLGKVPALVDYEYDTRGGPPDGTSERKWGARGAVWDRVCLDDWDRGRMMHEIVNVGRGIGVGHLIKNLLPTERDGTRLWLETALKWKKPADREKDK